jgi:hypothetical protein
MMTNHSMRSLIALSILLASAAPTVPAMAADTMTRPMTLGELRKMCAASDAEGQAACRFFILGAFQGLNLAGRSTPGAGGQFTERKEGKTFCVPEDLPQSAMVQKIVSYADVDMKAFPADAYMPAISFISAVIAKSYPCR